MRKVMTVNKEVIAWQDRDFCKNRLARSVQRRRIRLDASRGWARSALSVRRQWLDVVDVTLER
jgi:hypothetical protein